MTRIYHACFVFVVLLSSSALHATEPQLSSPGQPDWEKGQKAMLEGQTEQAIASFEQSLKQDPSLVCNYLSLAAAYLAEGKEEQAGEQLKRYLEAVPEHHTVREQYAELLLRMDQLAAAREQFERYESAIENHETLAQQQMVHCHSRLLEIATRLEDEYAKHLHRGIALYWLARQRSELADGGEELSSEGLLCQSASELVLARRERPDEARPCWYLHEVWSQLAQCQPASRWLRAAEEAAPFSYLTPAEQRRLHLASRRVALDNSRK